MSERVSTKAIELRIEWLNKALGRPLAQYVKHADGKVTGTDAFYADHTACYGGWRIECQGSTPFGSSRVSKGELLRQLEAILTAIRLARNEDTGSAWPKAMEPQVA